MTTELAAQRNAIRSALVDATNRELRLTGGGMVNDGETELAAPFGGLVSANRATLAKMRELEAGK